MLEENGIYVLTKYRQNDQTFARKFYGVVLVCIPCYSIDFVIVNKRFTLCDKYIRIESTVCGERLTKTWGNLTEECIHREAEVANYFSDNLEELEKLVKTAKERIIVILEEIYASPPPVILPPDERTYIKAAKIC